MDRNKIKGTIVIVPRYGHFLGSDRLVVAAVVKLMSMEKYKCSRWMGKRGESLDLGYSNLL